MESNNASRRIEADNVCKITDEPRVWTGEYINYLNGLNGKV